ncbi:cytochrome P450 [Xylariaceae sp. FL1272]|nr:cytochrome P450 [Xylariaceae sp. FL1272]
MAIMLALVQVSCYAVCLLVPYIGWKLLAVASYRILLHPLRGYPGPFLAKLTDGYGGWHTICKRTHLNIHKSHARYGLSDRSMRLFEPTLLEHIDVFLKLLLKSSKTQSHVEMTSSSQYLGFDIIGSLARLIAAKPQANTLMHLPAYRFLSPMLGFAVETERYLYSLLSAPENENIFDNIIGELVFFMTAGTYPTTYQSPLLQTNRLTAPSSGGTPPATIICALCFYLARHPSCYKTLAQEIRTTFSNAAQIHSGTKLSSCKYLRACIDESWACDGGWACCAEGNAGWDPATDENSARFKGQKAFVPFIVGPRACVGKATLYLEVSLIVAKMLWYFDFESAPGPLGRVGEGVPGDAHGRHRVDESDA